jgi:hypothetical protein
MEIEREYAKKLQGLLKGNEIERGYRIIGSDFIAGMDMKFRARRRLFKI